MLCSPLKKALDRVDELKREIAENKRLQKEKENAVSSFHYQDINK